VERLWIAVVENRGFMDELFWLSGLTTGFRIEYQTGRQSIYILVLMSSGKDPFGFATPSALRFRALYRNPK
jgi:hypothetical protein